MLINIISNSIEASDRNSKILINSFENNGKVNVEIIDEGLGISEEKKNIIFDDFYTSKDNGTDSA